VSVFKKLWGYLKEYKMGSILVPLFKLLVVVFNLLVPVLFGDAIDEIEAAHNVDFVRMWISLKQYPKLTGMQIIQ